MGDFFMRKFYSFLILLGKSIFIITFLFIVSFIIQSIRLDNKEIVLPCVHEELINIEDKDYYLEVEETVNCNYHSIEIKVIDELDFFDMKVIAIGFVSEINNVSNVDVYIYNESYYLFAKIYEDEVSIIEK